MKRLKGFWRPEARLALLVILGLVALSGLLLYKLGTLVGGLSSQEMAAASAQLGWTGLWVDALYLPLKLVRSAVYFLDPAHGQILTRLPNTLFGALTVVSFGWLIWLWHGRRTAILAMLLFATSAWTLHVSRLASLDVLYLWAIPTLLLIQVLLYRYGLKPLVWYGSLLTWGLLLYIPGLVWLILAQWYLQRGLLVKSWRHFSAWWQRLLAIVALVIWLPLLVKSLLKSGQLVAWLGLPTDWPTPLALLGQLRDVFWNLFVAGPSQSEIWLNMAPILDFFTLIICGLGIYFYLSHWQASRSRTIGWLFAIGVILVGLGGAVSLSLLVPLLYVAAAAGLAYLLREWLKVFPLNPLARGLGIGLVTLAVVISCVYNLRAYFVAWPHHTSTAAVFRHHR